MSQTVLIVARSELQRKELREAFHSYGFVTWETEDNDEALNLAATLTLTVVLIDLDTSIDGLELCKKIRQGPNNWLPVILLSSDNDELTCTLGLELGADDFVLKPYRIKELVARIKAILRRSELTSNGKAESDFLETDSFMRNGNLMLDPRNYALYKDNQLMELTQKEFELIYYLFLHKGQIVDRLELLNALSNDSHTLNDRIIDVFISRLRQKIEPTRKSPRYIRTVRGKGYLFIDQEKASS